MFIIHNSGLVVGTYGLKEDIPESQIPQAVEVQELPLLAEQRGKVPYHFWNGTSVEVRYRDRPLTEIELLQQENESLKQQLQQTNSDLVGFMDFYFSTTPGV